MAGLVPSRKEAAWRQRLRRFNKSGLTVAGFCRCEGVSSPSFYHWRKRLADGNGQSVLAAKRAKESFVPVRLTTALAPAAAPPVEIHLPNGVRVCLPRGDMAALRVGIEAAGGLPGSTVASASIAQAREDARC